MKTPSRLTGYALAAAAAGLFATVTANSAFAADKAAAADKATMKCDNSSACKGHGACKTAKNECKGKNSCKGTAPTMQKSEADCKAAQEAAKKS